MGPRPHWIATFVLFVVASLPTIAVVTSTWLAAAHAHEILLKMAFSYRGQR